MGQEHIDFHIRKYSFWGMVAALATFLTVMSQLPVLVLHGLSSSISRSVWMFFFGLILVVKWESLVLRRVVFPFVMVGCYTIFVLIATMLNTNGGYLTGLFSNVLLSFFILLVSMLIGKDLTERDLYLCGKIYVLASVILALVLYVTIYRSYDISNVVYAYSSKNSAGVILFTGALIAFVYGWHPGRKWVNFCNLMVITFLIYMVMIMKVRAMIVCIPIVAICAFMRAPFRRSIRVPVLLLCISLVIALQFDSVYNLLIDNILFAGRGGSLVDASSGRYEQWASFFENMQGQELFGDGQTEQESLILTAFLQCGIFMGGMIITYAAWPVTWALRRTKEENNQHLFLLLLIALTYFIDAIFEMLAPFGPGARCFYLWMLFGCILAKGGKGVCFSRKGEL